MTEYDDDVMNPANEGQAPAELPDCVDCKYVGYECMGVLYPACFRRRA